MKSPVRYIFDRSFDEEEVKEEIIEEVIPTFSEDELYAAQQLSFQEGIVEGRRLAESEMTAHLLQAMGIWSQRLEAFMDHEHLKHKNLQQEAALLAHHIALKACGKTFYTQAVQRIEESFATATSFLLQPGKITLHVHPDLLAPVQVSLHVLMDKGAVEILPNETLEMGDCQLSWHGGGAEFKLAETLEKINSTIKEYTEDKGHG